MWGKAPIVGYSDLLTISLAVVPASHGARHGVHAVFRIQVPKLQKIS
jgi:hypothetical protein